jgi:homoserine dehydrogenase
MRYVYIHGLGSVGGALLKRLERMRKRGLLEFLLVGASDSTGHFWMNDIMGGEAVIHDIIARKNSNPRGLAGVSESECLGKGSLSKVSSLDLVGRLNALTALASARVLFVDASAVDSSALFEKLLSQTGDSLKIITANKVPLSGPWEISSTLFSPQNIARIGAEATVGAGVPMIRSLVCHRELADGEFSVDAVLSGTLSCIASGVETGRSFSSALDGAIKAGYTEPNPVDDLSAVDVLRKAVILARFLGMSIDIQDVQFDPFLMNYDGELTEKAVVRSAGRIGKAMTERFKKSQKNGTALRFVASINGDRVAVGWREFGESHPLSELNDLSNMMVISDPILGDAPHAFRGAGAGVEATAYGLTSDIIRLSRA